MLKPERQDRILQQVMHHSIISVADLAAHLAVSEITVRRDLDEMAREGRLQRVRGGARRLDTQEVEPPVVQRELQNPEAKRAIGQAAADLVHDGDVIGIASGSTTLMLARALALRPFQNLHVVTNGLSIVNTLLRKPGVRLTFVGGTVNADEMGTVGPLAEDMLRSINIGRLFIGCGGIDAQAGVTENVYPDSTVGVDRALVAASREIIALADHDKFRRVNLMQIVPVQRLTLLVTDDLTADDVLNEFRRQEIEVIVAPLAVTSAREHA